MTWRDIFNAHGLFPRLFTVVHVSTTFDLAESRAAHAVYVLLAARSENGSLTNSERRKHLTIHFPLRGR